MSRAGATRPESRPAPALMAQQRSRPHPTAAPAPLQRARDFHVVVRDLRQCIHRLLHVRRFGLRHHRRHMPHSPPGSDRRSTSTWAFTPESPVASGTTRSPRSRHPATAGGRPGRRQSRCSSPSGDLPRRRHHPGCTLVMKENSGLSAGTYHTPSWGNTRRTAIKRWSNQVRRIRSPVSRSSRTA